MLSEKYLKRLMPALLLAGLSFFYTSCKKDNPAPMQGSSKSGGGTSTTGVNGDLRDTLADISSLYYLWNSNIPSTFKPHTYSSADTLYSELEAIKAFSPVNAVTNTHYDHFSFVLAEADYQKEFVQGVSTSFGMGYAFDRNGNLRANYVAHASSVYLSGVRRGWQIISINGTKAATDASTIAALNAALNSSSATFVFQNPATGKNVSLTVTKQDIPDDEVITTKVFTAGSKKVGYLAYNTFLTQTDKSGNPIHPGMDSAFAKLSAAGVTDMVIDLRYNGGGYTLVAQQMDNALLPASADKKVLYTEHYNDSLNKYYKLGYKNLDHDVTVNISKTDVGNPTNLPVNSVVFIVSRNTASAAELVINNLTPYISNIKLIGLGKGRSAAYANTAGKPFGYAGQFPLPNKKPIYEAFVLNFETKNANGADNYVSGFKPDLQVYDGVEFDFGDPKEDGLQAALGYMSTGTLSYMKNNNQLALGNHTGTAGSLGLEMNSQIRQTRFSGMVKRNAIVLEGRKGVQVLRTLQGKIKPAGNIQHN